ncbi:MAG TPA: efflux transporter outer membrane subunit [Steroidobacteraceae bacterium]|nr:efflux transporter outer membrane subunit [Steroidobacteraceae bacterium]
MNADTHRPPARLRGVAAAAALLAACTVGPNFVRPTAKVPDHWSPQAAAASKAGPSGPAAKQPAKSPPTKSLRGAPLGGWWRGFGDPQLDALIARALRSNLDLRAALLRIEEARALGGIAAAGGLPALSVDAAFSRQRMSETTATGALFNSIGRTHLPGVSGVGIANPYNQLQLSGDASWEIDLFGRVRRAVEAANAGVQVSLEDRRAVMVAVLADVAQNYVDLRGAQARDQIAKDNLATIGELVELTRMRRAAGLTTQIDVSQAQSQAAATRAELPAFELQITQAINALSRLLGLAPEALRGELLQAAAVPAAPPVPIGVPADLARRRPDIREAEAALHAATAQIGVSVANLFPRLSLSASGGFQSETGGSLLQWASRFATIGPTLELPVFDRGRWLAVRLYKVRAQEAALAYQRTVLNGLHEVENALSAYAADRQRRAWLGAAVTQDREALALSRQRYRSGLANFVEVLVALRTLQRDELSQADGATAVSVDSIGVYRALGGGW